MCFEISMSEQLCFIKQNTNSTNSIVLNDIFFINQDLGTDLKKGHIYTISCHSSIL